MPKRREKIAMTTEEQATHMESGRTLQLATIGLDGQPHLTAMWYAVIDGKICFNTYGTSQKSLNMERDPRVTCMIESGTEYEQLKGLVLQGRVQVIDEAHRIDKFMAEIARRYPNSGAGEGSLPPKRKVYVVIPAKVYSWDHSKLPQGVH